MDSTNNIILTAVPVDSLLKQLRQIVKEEIRAEHTQMEGEKLFSPSEACKVFHPAISKPTLASWTAAGFLKRYDIGGRVYYRYSEIIEATKTMKRYKRADIQSNGRGGSV